MDKISTIDKVDNYLKEKKSSELSLVFMMAFSVIALLIYLSFYDSTERMLMVAKNSHRDIKGKLRSELSYLSSIQMNGDKNYLIKKISRDIEIKKHKLDETKYANTYVDNKLKELSYLLFNEMKWAKFMDSIAFSGKKYDVDISLISNDFFEPTLQKIRQVLTIKVDFSGEFKSILKFVNELEESDLVVDIDNLIIESNETIIGTLDISIWGMKY